MRPTKIKLAVLTAISLVSTGCATDPRTGQPSLKETFASEDPCSNNARNVGILLGGIAGAIIGNQVRHSDGARIAGALVGATAGGFIGNDIDQRRCELYKIAKANNLEMQVVDIKSSDVGISPPAHSSGQQKPDAVGMQVSIKDNNHQFESGSDTLTPEAANYFRQIAAQYSFVRKQQTIGPRPTAEQLALLNGLRNRRILLVGHTDDTGSSRLNADLSERRAKVVARVFQEEGILEENIFFQGAGETLPIADNRTEEGRARNRRVEIIDLADEQAFRAFLERRSANVAFYRNASSQAPGAGGFSLAVAPVPATPTVEADARDRTPATRKGLTVAATGHMKKKDVASGSKKTEARAQSAFPRATSGSPKLTNAQFVDFGGSNDLKRATVDVGRIAEDTKGFSLLSEAHADEPVRSACINDRPRIAHGVKSLKTEKTYETSEYMPGLYRTSWAGEVNGHLMAMTNVAVLRDGGVPANRPTLLIYRDYKPGVKATYTGTPEVNVYRGDKAVLYRVFVDGPVQCIDMVIPNSAPGKAPGSHLFYNKSATTYFADWAPSIAH